MSEKKAVVLLSGGLDSTTVAAIAQQQGYEVYALSFDYGQNHRVELEFAARVAERLGVARHAVVKVDLRSFGGSALTSNTPVPKHRSAEAIGHGVPVTYVPARNTVFLSLALAWAETLGATDIFIGVNALDYSGYPDCRPAFIAAFERLANVATAAAVEGRGRFAIHAPLIDRTKAQIIRWGAELGVPYELTHSCYDPVVAADARVLACGHCDSCQLRRAGFEQAGVPDPTAYA